MKKALGYFLTVMLVAGLAYAHSVTTTSPRHGVTQVGTILLDDGLLYTPQTSEPAASDNACYWADSTNWNPGSGEGLYCKINGTWTLLSGDTNTTYNAGNGLSLGGTTFTVDNSVVHMDSEASAHASSASVHHTAPTVLTLPLKAQWFDPTAADVDIFMTMNAPVGATISEINCYSVGGNTTIIVSNGTSVAGTDVTDAGGLTCLIGEVVTDSTLTNTTITAGNVVAVHVSAVVSAPTRIAVEIN